MDRIPIALQLYSIREDCARDLEGSIKAVAEMGYEGVEFAGYYQRGADELKSLCDAHGLQIVGTHIGLDALQGSRRRPTGDAGAVEIQNEIHASVIGGRGVNLDASTMAFQSGADDAEASHDRRHQFLRLEKRCEWRRQ